MPQEETEATYAPKLSREDGRIDWSKPAEIIDRQIRAFDPWPGTFTTLDGSSLKILAARPASGSGIPGTALDTALTIACGSHAVRLTRVQLPGRAALDAEAFLRGHPVALGHRTRTMTRWALLLEYDGTPFVGWQRQINGLSVQEVLEQAASQLNRGQPVASIVAGRTDAGVHAEGQVAHIDLPDGYGAKAIRDALNYHMKPHPVVVLSAAAVPDDWSARFSANRRAYRFRILNRRSRPALMAGRVWHVAGPLDATAMHEAAQRLVGRHDFTSFRAASCQAKSPSTHAGPPRGIPPRRHH